MNPPTVTATTIEVSRDHPFETLRVVEDHLATPGRGELLVEVERFSIATNNLGYALLGDALGFWKAFPAAPGWGRPPVWGAARVVAGDPELAPVGTRLMGFLPMGTHASIRAERTESGILSVDPGRRDLLPFYRRLTAASTDAVSANVDVEVALLHVIPFAAVLAADLVNRGATHVIVSSASSRSAACLARLLVQGGVDVTGLTSDRHQEAATAMAAYTRVIPYDDITSHLDLGADVVYVDIAGSSNVTSTLHDRIGNRLSEHIAVGGTHLRRLPDQPAVPSLAGPTPVQFSTGDREQEIADASGLETVVELERQARTELVPWAAQWLQVVELEGVASATDLWQETAHGSTDPLAAAVVLP